MLKVAEIKYEEVIASFHRSLSTPIPTLVEKIKRGTGEEKDYKDDERAIQELRLRNLYGFSKAEKTQLAQLVQRDESNDKPGLLLLKGFIFQYGLGVVKDEGKAKQYYLDAESKRSVSALNRLISLSKVISEEVEKTSGISIGRDILSLGSGIDGYANKAAEQHNPEGLWGKFKLNESQDLGLLTRLPRNKVANAEVLFELGYTYSTHSSRNVYPKDDGLASSYFAGAAAQGHADSLARLGVNFRDGVGVKQDYVAARACFATAAAKGHGRAFLMLGGLYLYGLGIQADPVRGRYLQVFSNKFKTDKRYHLAKLAVIADDSTDLFTVRYHIAILSEDRKELNTLLSENSSAFFQLFFKYEGGSESLTDTSWLHKALKSLIEDDKIPVPAIPQTLTPEFLKQVTLLTSIHLGYGVKVLEACMKVKDLTFNLEELFAALIEVNPAILFDKKAILVFAKTYSNWPYPGHENVFIFDKENRDRIVSYAAPYYRQKEEKERAQSIMSFLDYGEDFGFLEGKADLFDLQHYIALDNKKLLRDKDRRELRQATYTAILTTLAQLPVTKPSDSAGEVKDSETDKVEQKLLLIIETAIAQETQFKQSSSHEFMDILQGLKNNLDQVIREYQRFTKIFAADLANLNQQTQTYANVLSLLQREKPSTTDQPEEVGDDNDQQEPDSLVSVSKIYSNLTFPIGEYELYDTGKTTTPIEGIRITAHVGAQVSPLSEVKSSSESERVDTTKQGNRYIEHDDFEVYVLMSTCKLDRKPNILTDTHTNQILICFLKTTDKLADADKVFSCVKGGQRTRVETDAYVTYTQEVWAQFLKSVEFVKDETIEPSVLQIHCDLSTPPLMITDANTNKVNVIAGNAEDAQTIFLIVQGGKIDLEKKLVSYSHETWDEFAAALIAQQLAIQEQAGSTPNSNGIFVQLTLPGSSNLLEEKRPNNFSNANGIVQQSSIIHPAPLPKTNLVSQTPTASVQRDTHKPDQGAKISM